MSFKSLINTCPAFLPISVAPPNRPGAVSITRYEPDPRFPPWASDDRLLVLSGRSAINGASRHFAPEMLRHPSLELTACVVSKEGAMDLRQELMEGRVPVSQMGSVVATGRLHPPFVVVDTEGVEVAAVTECLGDLAASDCSPLTCRSYAFALLRWFRVLWLLGVGDVNLRWPHCDGLIWPHLRGIRLWRDGLIWPHPPGPPPARITAERVRVRSWRRWWWWWWCVGGGCGPAGRSWCRSR